MREDYTPILIVIILILLLSLPFVNQWRIKQEETHRMEVRKIHSQIEAVRQMIVERCQEGR
jgi:hypothetical protein